MYINIYNSHKDNTAYVLTISLTILTEINECLNENNCKQTCIDEIGSYSCSCPSGFSLASDLISCTC